MLKIEVACSIESSDKFCLLIQECKKEINFVSIKKENEQYYLLDSFGEKYEIDKFDGIEYHMEDISKLEEIIVSEYNNDGEHVKNHSCSVVDFELIDSFKL